MSPSSGVPMGGFANKGAFPRSFLLVTFICNAKFNILISCCRFIILVYCAIGGEGNTCQKALLPEFRYWISYKPKNYLSSILEVWKLFKIQLTFSSHQGFWIAPVDCTECKDYFQLEKEDFNVILQ